ncbi:MAG: L,D-transpeptidase family protein [Nitrospirota bacterium]|nr:L,D-transpeptidase family protein [Nitrospirota bacterium]
MKTHILQIVLILCLPLNAIAAAAEEVMTGGEEVYRVLEGDSLLLISAKFGVNLERIRNENSLDPEQPLRPGTELLITTRKIAPAKVDQGLVIDIPGRMLYYFKAGRLELSCSVGLGRPGWRTPAGGFVITGKEENPVWHVPASIQAIMQEKGMPVLTAVPPGPDNPLGKYALYTSRKGICIHETIWPTTVYRFRSHGCIRLLPQDIERLYRDVDDGTPGELIYEPVKVAVSGDGKVFLQVDPDIYKKARDPMDVVRRRLDELGAAGKVDWGKVAAVVAEEAGVAEEVTDISGSNQTN